MITGLKKENVGMVDINWYYNPSRSGHQLEQWNFYSMLSLHVLFYSFICSRNTLLN